MLQLVVAGVVVVATQLRELAAVSVAMPPIAVVSLDQSPWMMTHLIRRDSY